MLGRDVEEELFIIEQEDIELPCDFRLAPCPGTAQWSLHCVCSHVSLLCSTHKKALDELAGILVCVICDQLYPKPLNWSKL
jgi:hypothetical protein